MSLIKSKKQLFFAFPISHITMTRYLKIASGIIVDVPEIYLRYLFKWLTNLLEIIK